jgi:putative addiction module component (TIGR02574 family)
MELGRAMKEPLRIESLSPDERLDLLERLWDSLSATPADVPVTEAQRVELERRSRALDRDMVRGKRLGVPGDEVVRRLRARR